MGRLFLKLLGPPLVVLNGTSLTFRRRKATALLSYLAVTARPHSRESLAHLLASEVSDTQARMHLRNALTDLRGTLGEYVVATSRTVSLNDKLPCETDVKTFIDMTGSTDDTNTLARAVALYEDDLLVGFVLREASAFEDWLMLERERLRRRFVRTAQTLLDRHATAGENEAAIAYAQRILACEPWREETHRQLMHLLVRTGQRSAALAQYEACCRALSEEMDIAPHVETRALFEQLQADPAPPRHNLPTPYTTFVGRGEELVTLTRLMDDPRCRLVTILGLSGVGKTRLAHEVAARYVTMAVVPDIHPFPDGIFVVGSGTDAGLQSVRQLCIAVADSVGLSGVGPRMSVEQLGIALRNRALLLVLDNVENIEALGDLLTTLLAQAPRLVFLATSCTPLHLPEERVLDLDGLAVPTEPADIERADASILFLQYALQVGATLPQSEDEKRAVVRICQHAQGFPLALLLAAWWLRGMSYVATADDLERGIGLLNADVPYLPKRQRSVGGMIATAWGRLTEGQQAMLRQAAVFRGGFDRNAAYAVLGATPTDLLALRNQSLVSHNAHGRYSVHPLVWWYADTQLAKHPVARMDVQARHATYYAAWITYAENVGTERSNIRAAIDWAVAHNDAGTFAQLWSGVTRLCHQYGTPASWADFVTQVTCGIRERHAVLPSVTTKRMLGRVLCDYAHALVLLSRGEEALPLLDEARALGVATRTRVLLQREADVRGLAYATPQLPPYRGAPISWGGFRSD